MKKIIAKIKSWDKPMIIRVGLQVCAILNEIIALIGLSSFASDPIYQTISAVVLIAISCLNAWKNNDFTHLAQLSGKVLTALKDGDVDEKELEDILKKANENKEEKK